MTSRFQTCLSLVLKHEGGYVNHKNDRGGATNKGITQKVYSDFLKLRGFPDRDVANIHDAEVETIYQANYWKPAKCDLLPEPLDCQVFDAAVNHGVKRAVIFLQRALGVGEDGSVGKGTLAALHEEVLAVGVSAVCKMYLDQRESFYDRIIANDPTQAVFAKGWSNRVDSMREVV